jgi:integrase
MPRRNQGPKLEWRQERKTWEIVWYEQGRRKRLSTGTENRKDADKIYREFCKTEERRAISRIVGDVLTDYQKEHAPFTKSPERIGYAILHLTPFFGETFVEDITAAKCKEYSIKRDASQGTIRRELGTLRAALHHDKKENRIKNVPHVWLPPHSQPKDRWLTRKEAAALLRASRKVANHLPWFIILSLYSGQRKQAVLKLTWDRVDLERGIINWEYGSASKKKRPLQPMPDELKLFLRLLARHGKKGPVINMGGRAIKDIRKGLDVAMTKAGIENATPHTLKHTAITWMLQNGTDLWAIAGFTGTSVKTIEATYGHHAPDYMEAARTSFKTARKRRLTVP